MHKPRDNWHCYDSTVIPYKVTTMHHVDLVNFQYEDMAAVSVSHQHGQLIQHRLMPLQISALTVYTV